MISTRHAQRQSERSHGFVTGLVCGTAIGTIVGLLVAAKPGAELREELADSAQRFRRKVGDAYDQANNVVADTVAASREAFTKGREKFEEARSQFSGDMGSGGATEHRH